MRKGRVYRSIVICMIAVLFAVILVPRSFYGVKVVRTNMHGSVSFIPDKKKLVSELEDAGLKLVAKNDGTNEFIAESSSDSVLGQWFNPTKAHNKLINYGILSYEMYTYTPENCAVMADLTIVLDFSGYAVTSFKEEAIQTLRSAITGNSMGTLRPTATVYNQDGTTGTASLELKGRNGMSADGVNLESYALRLIFPGGYGDIELAEGSIAFMTWFSDLPIAVEFDLRQFTAIDRLVIADGATNSTGLAGSDGTNHLHMLCNDKSQIRYTVGNQNWEIKQYLFKDNIYKKI